MGWGTTFKIFSSSGLTIFDENQLIEDSWIVKEFNKDNRWYEVIYINHHQYTTHIEFHIKYGTVNEISEISKMIYEKYGIDNDWEIISGGYPD